MDTAGVKYPNIVKKKNTKYWYYANNFAISLLVQFFKHIDFQRRYDNFSETHI